MTERISALKQAGYKFDNEKNKKRYWTSGDWNKAKIELTKIGYKEKNGKMVGEKVTVSQSVDFLIVE